MAPGGKGKFGGTPAPPGGGKGRPPGGGGKGRPAAPGGGIGSGGVLFAPGPPGAGKGGMGSPDPGRGAVSRGCEYELVIREDRHGGTLATEEVHSGGLTRNHALGELPRRRPRHARERGRGHATGEGEGHAGRWERAAAGLVLR